MARSYRPASILKPGAPRSGRLVQALARASVVGLLAAAASLWGMFASNPPFWVMVVVAIMPWAAMLAARAEPESRLVGRTRNHLLTAVIVPGLALAVFGLEAEGAALDWRVPIIVALAVAAPSTAFADAAFGRRRARGRVVTSLVVFCSMSCYGYGGISLANARLDAASPERFRAEILGKRIVRGRSTTQWTLLLAPWGPRSEPGEAKVRASLYRAVDPGDSVCVDLHAGALGIAWYAVLPCGVR